MIHYKKGSRYMSPAAWIFTAGGILLLYSLFFAILRIINQSDVFGLNPFIGKSSAIFMAMAIVLFTVSLALYIAGGDSKRIENCVKKRLFDPRYGNPLGFREGELFPPVKCQRINKGAFELSIKAVSCTVEDLLKIVPVISSSINGKYSQYAVVNSEADEAFNGVAYRIENVLADKSLTVNSAEGRNVY